MILPPKNNLRARSTGTTERDGSRPPELLARISDRTALVGIIGLGYVGLPLAMACVERGFRVLGFDVDPEKPAKLGRGESYIKHLGVDRVGAMVRSGRFAATTEFARLGEPDVIVVCVPTPLTPQREPDMTYVIGSAAQIKASLRRGQLVVLESTTYPGTTDELLKGILETTGLRCGVDFFLAFSPEREDPGRKDFTTTTTPKVVGGVDEASGDLAQALYDQIVEKTVRVSSARVAEASKLTENIFRAVNIALVNELKMVYDRMGIDIWEVLDAAATKPFGFMRFNPGPGWGGHCIPLDPFYLSWKAREYGETAKFIELAGDINVQMPRYVVGKLQLALNERGKAVKGSRILILGIAYKKDIDDDRESPAYEIMDLLEELGAELAYHDPHLPVLRATRRHGMFAGLRSTPLTADTLSTFDAAVIVTDHAAVDYELLAQSSLLVVDTRGLQLRRRVGVVKA
jgi:UDP-N-acetyl-D-glucosamine dehydrogenase